MQLQNFHLNNIYARSFSVVAVDFFIKIFCYRFLLFFFLFIILFFCFYVFYEQKWYMLLNLLRKVLQGIFNGFVIHWKVLKEKVIVTSYTCVYNNAIVENVAFTILKSETRYLFTYLHNIYFLKSSLCICYLLIFNFVFYE